MLRINLLPQHINVGKIKLMHMALAAVLFSVLLIGLLFWGFTAQGMLAVAKQRLDTANQYQQQYTAIDTQIGDVKTKVSKIKARQDFVASAQSNNTAWPQAIAAVGASVPPFILLNSLQFAQADPHEVNLTGFSQSEMNLARWWLQLRNDTSRYTNAVISLPSHPYSPGGGNTAAAGGGFGGMMGGYGRPGFGGGGKGRFGAMGPPSMGGPGGYPGMPGMAGGFGGGGFGARNSNTASATPDQVAGKTGFDFTATLMLTDKLAPPAVAPTWPAASASGGAGSGFAGMGGMGGGMGVPPGMPPGAMGGMPSTMGAKGGD